MVNARLPASIFPASRQGTFLSIAATVGQSNDVMPQPLLTCSLPPLDVELLHPTILVRRARLTLIMYSTLALLDPKRLLTASEAFSSAYLLSLIENFCASLTLAMRAMNGTNLSLGRVVALCTAEVSSADFGIGVDSSVQEAKSRRPGAARTHFTQSHTNFHEKLAAAFPAGARPVDAGKAMAAERRHRAKGSLPLYVTL
ncbi:hypothetical protein HPB51_003068 [Rhipicephalus microplus]|uniref:Uncharacterized protein n=1 Tax=Rhipicephalus microplus TaxID=6941 RepID=A0A9J6E5G0_RHIMP|nr:hypothetical protein HPB51_003068 [Rhipicephalus microplus]